MNNVLSKIRTPFRYTFRNATIALIIINFAVFFLYNFTNLIPISEDFFSLNVIGFVYRKFIWQPVTYMFMHGNFSHLFFNMFAVLMFAPVLEGEWGVKKFLLYYFVCGIGAAIIQEGVWALRIEHLLATYNAESVMLNYVNQVVTIGASGAVFGILLAFGWLFPDVPMYIIFVPIPIRARIFVNRAFCRNCEYVRR